MLFSLVISFIASSVATGNLAFRHPSHTHLFLMKENTFLRVQHHPATPMRNPTESYYSLCLVKSLRDDILAHNVSGSPCSYQQSCQFPEPQGSPCLQIANASSEPAQPPLSSPIPSSPYDVAGPQLQPEPPALSEIITQVPRTPEVM